MNAETRSELRKARDAFRAIANSGGFPHPGLYDPDDLQAVRSFAEECALVVGAFLMRTGNQQ